jgi:hypothetical protein
MVQNPAGRIKPGCPDAVASAVPSSLPKKSPAEMQICFNRAAPCPCLGRADYIQLHNLSCCGILGF